MKYLIFDLDDTLLDFYRGEIESLKFIFNKYNLKNTEEGINQYLPINKEIWNQIENGGD